LCGNFAKIVPPRYFHTIDVVFMKGKPNFLVFGGLGKKKKEKSATNLPHLYQFATSKLKGGDAFFFV